MKRSILALTAVAILWPPAFFLYCAAPLESVMYGRDEVSAVELGRLLRVGRWEVDIPAGKDGWFLGFQSEVDGAQSGGGVATVHGGSRIVLLMHRNTEDGRVDYMWYERPANSSVFSHRDASESIVCGSFADPLKEAGVSSTRTQRHADIGDYLYVGDRKRISHSQDGVDADFAIRLALTPPIDAATDTITIEHAPSTQEELTPSSP